MPKLERGSGPPTVSGHGLQGNNDKVMDRHGQADSRYEEQTLGVKIIVSGGGQNSKPLLEAHILGKVHAPTMNVLTSHTEGRSYGSKDARVSQAG